MELMAKVDLRLASGHSVTSIPWLDHGLDDTNQYLFLHTVHVMQAHFPRIYNATLRSRRSQNGMKNRSELY